MHLNSEFPWLSRLSHHFRVLAIGGAILLAIGTAIFAIMGMSQAGFLPGLAVLVGGAFVIYQWVVLNMLMSEVIALALRIEKSTRTTVHVTEDVFRATTDLAQKLGAASRVDRVA